VETRAVAVNTPSERLILASSREITRRRMIERAQQALFASVSHDLKSPLAAISLQAQLLRRNARKLAESSPEELEPRFDVILTATKRMSAIIDELVEVAQLRLGHPLRLNYSHVDLVQLARRSVEEHRQSAASYQISLIATQEPVIGFWDAGRLDRVFDNLLSNAVKYSPGGGEITVTIDCECDADGNPWAVVAVKDQGIGIPAADLPHIFEHFRRGANAQDRMVGSGIGLAGVRQIVEQHDGSVTAESTEGVGSTVRLRLPLGNRELLKNGRSDFRKTAGSVPVMAQGVHESDMSGNLTR
jgi:signal transduction histidine kinase